MFSETTFDVVEGTTEEVIEDAEIIIDGVIVEGTELGLDIYNEEYDEFIEQELEKEILTKKVSQEATFLTDQEIEVMADNNYALVFYVVKMFNNSGIPYEELTSIAMVGYAKALKTYNKAKKVKFSTYAFNCIRNEILFFLRKETQHMKNDISLQKILSTDKNGNNLSLEQTVGDLDLEVSSAEDKIMMQECLTCLESAVTLLSTKERYIITHRFGLGDCDELTQKEIADAIGMSQANVSKLEKNIMEKLKKLLSSKYKIKSLWD